MERGGSAMILVTGGTGFVGRRVVEELRRQGYPVRVLSRSEPGRGFAEEWSRGDVTDAEAVRRAAAGCRAVAHLVAIRREWKDRTFEAVTAGGTRNVVRAAREAGVERFLHTSALGLTDRPDTGYMRAKAAAEAAVRESGLAFTIFRPSFVLGPGGFVEEYGRLIRKAPLVPIPGTGAFPVQPVARDDVAAAFRRALEVPAAAGKTYDLAGPERTTFEGLIDAIMAAMGRRKGKAHVPLALMRPLAAVLQRVTPNPPATTDEIKMLLAGNVGDPEPAVRDLGLKLTPLSQAVQEAVEGIPPIARRR